MFIYTELPDGRVSLEMDMADFDELLTVLGFALAAALDAGSKSGRDRSFIDFVDLLNRVNRTNARFQPYELPAERSEAP